MVARAITLLQKTHEPASGQPLELPKIQSRLFQVNAEAKGPVFAKVQIKSTLDGTNWFVAKEIIASGTDSVCAADTALLGPVSRADLVELTGDGAAVEVLTA